MALKRVASRKASALEPKKAAKDVKEVWDREISVYYAFVVKVTGRTGSKVKFLIVHEGKETGVKGGTKAFVVDLHDGKMCFGDAPSTAQHATVARKYGVLFLSKDFAELNGVIVMGGPPKIPKQSSL